MTQPEPDPPPWLPLVSEALTAAVFEDWRSSVATLMQLQDEHGAEVLPVAMLAWIDTMLDVVPQTTGKLVIPAFYCLAHGHITDVDNTSPEVAWCGRLIAARANDDEQMYRALIDSVPTDEQYARNLATLLQTIALNLRMAGWPHHHTKENPSRA